VDSLRVTVNRASGKYYKPDYCLVQLILIIHFVKIVHTHLDVRLYSTCAGTEADHRDEIWIGRHQRIAKYRCTKHCKCDMVPCDLEVFLQ
jgi:hypothetical protein